MAVYLTILCTPLNGQAVHYVYSLECPDMRALAQTWTKINFYKKWVLSPAVYTLMDDDMC